MKLSVLIFFTFVSLLPSMEMEKWADRVSKDAPHAVLNYVKSKDAEKLKEFDKTKHIAGPFKFPILDASSVQGNKVVSSGETHEFLSRSAKLKSTPRSKSKDGYNAIRFSTDLQGDSKAIVTINGAGIYRLFINGRYMAQKLNGLVHERGETSYLVKLKKGKNEFLVFPNKTKIISCDLEFVTVSAQVQEEFKAHIIEKYSSLNDVNKSDYIKLINEVAKSKDSRIIASSLARILKHYDFGKDDWEISNVFRSALTADTFAVLSRQVSKENLTEKLVAIMLKVDRHSMVERLSSLILNERGKYVEEFLFKALELCTTDKMKAEFRRNLYEAAKMFKYCGNYNSANKLLGKYRTIMNVKDDRHFKEVEALFIETSDPGKVRPRFVGDPETDHLKREVDTLLAEKPGKEAYQRLLRLFRNKGHQLFEDSDRKLSLRAYLASSLKDKQLYAKGFAAYLKGRYQEDVNDSIQIADVEDLEKILSEVEGLTQFPEARKFLMQEYYNRGEIRKSLRDACFLIKYGHEESLAASYILILEDRLAIPQNSRVTLPDGILNNSVQLAGEAIKIKDLVSKYRTRTFKTSSNGPGSLQAQFELAEVSNGSFESYDSDKKIGTLKLHRQPLQSNFYNDRWISSSPYGIKVFDKKGKSLWSVRKLVKEAERREASIPKSYESKIIENTLYNLEYAEGSKHLELIARDLNGKEVWSTQTLKGYEKWEPCSLPFSKFNTAVVLLMEKQRTTSPVISVGFINLSTGSLNKIIPISRTRDPFSHSRRYSDISNVARFHDRFTADEESIYLYTGSGQIIKINALEENISWVTGYRFRLAGVSHHFSMNLSRASAAAPGFITKNGNKIINFNPARIGWFIIDDQDGSVLWKNFSQIPNYIHSRGTSEVIFSTGSDDRRNLLVRLDPQTGKRIWIQDLLGIRVTGEGVLSNSKLYLPTVKGIAEFDAEKGKLIKISPLKETPTSVKRIDDSWIVKTRINAYVFASGEKLTADISDKQEESKINPVKIDNKDSRFWSLETAVEFPFNFSSRDRDEVREIFKTSKPGHYIIRIGNDVALFRESSYINKRYTPPKVIWSNSIKNFDVVKDNLLIRYEDRVEVFNVLTRRNLFVYEASQEMSDILSGMSKVSMARLYNDKVYILTAKKELLEFSLNSGKKLKSYRLSGSDFAIFENKILSLSSRYSKDETSLYEMNGDLKLIKKFKDKIIEPHLTTSNSKYFGTFSKDRLYIFDKQKSEIKSYNTNRKTAWRLIGDFAAVSPNTFINLKTQQQKTVKGVYLCENGGAIIIERDDKITYINEKGQTQLENIDKKFYFSTSDPIKEIRTFGRGSDFGEQLILCSHEGERIYSLKDGKLLSARNWAYGDRETQLLFTEKSRLVMKSDKAFVFSNLGRQLPVNRLKESTEGIESLSWVTVPSESWININNNAAPKAEYRYSENAEEVVIQVRMKGAMRQINGLAISLNTGHYDQYVFAEAMEGRSTFINVSGHLVTDEMKNHYFDDDAYEYLEISLDKSKLVNITHNPSVQIEISSYKNAEKAGFYRIGGSFAPGAKSLNLNTQTPLENVTKNKISGLQTLYDSASCLMADGITLSKFITARRSIKSVDDNISYLEALLKKHKENISAIGILTCLYLEKAHKQKSSAKLDDNSLINISKQCRSFAMGIKMKKEWINFALTIFNLEILNDRNQQSLPSKVGLKGEGEIFIPLDGSIQVSALDERVLLAPGLFNRSYVQKIRELEFRMSDYPSILGAFKLLKDDKLTNIASSNGSPNSAMVNGNWKNSIQAVLHYNDSGSQEAYRIKDRNTILSIKEVVLPKLEPVYKWDGESLLANIKLNPVSEWQATDMLRRWIDINKVSDDKLQDILIEVMNYNPDNYNLIYSVCKIFMDKANDLELIKSLLRKAKVQINYRRRIFLQFSSMKGWNELGPIFAAEDIKSPKFEPLPENSRLSKVKDFTDTNGNKFQFKPYVTEKKRTSNRGVIYLKTDFEAKNAAKAYLHIGSSGHEGYGTFTIWFNGKKVTEGSFQRWRNFQSSTLLECRQGKNNILVKYDFLVNKKFKIKIGDLYGASVSYLK